MNKFNKGFTLAEVLITLGIIGVVAALAIPELIHSTGGKEYEVAANKALTTINNAIEARIGIDGELFDEGFLPANDFYSYLMRPPRNGAILTTTVCGPLNGNNPTWCTLKDGMIMRFSGYGSSGTNGYTAFIIDTNGARGPSASGLTDNTNAHLCKMTGNITGSLDGISLGSITSREAIPRTNNCPDLIRLCFFDDADGFRIPKIVPCDRRTRNILATGNARRSE